MYANNVGWTEMIQSFRNLVMPDFYNGEFIDLFNDCGAMVHFVLSTESMSENERIWLRSNKAGYSKTVKCMYKKISDLAGEDSTQLATRFLPEILGGYDENPALLRLFKSLIIKNRYGEDKSFWNELERQFWQAYESSNVLRDLIQNDYNDNLDKYLLEYATNLCIELWWFWISFRRWHFAKEKDFL